jgi:PKD repeat protein
VPLLAPSGSSIILTASNNAIPASGTVELIAQVLEPSGTPPHPGTHVTFTTTLGVLEPAEATTDINGRVRVLFRANGANGTATITASSGGATTGANGAAKIAVGTAAVGRVIVNAAPATIPSGGRSTITAAVLDINGTPLAGTLVSFSTDAGTLTSSGATTNSDGAAETSLTTSQTANITASVGATAPPGGTGTGSTTPTQASGTTKVTVIPATTVTITPPATPPSAGLPASFTFVITVPTGGNPVRELRVTWGDNTGTQSFGAVTGSQSASHVYTTPGPYTVTATVIDVAGISVSVSTTVNVIPVPRPTVIVTATPQTQFVNGTINFNIQVTVPQGIGVQRTRIDFGDGEVRELGGATSTTVQKQYTTPGQRTVRVTVTDTANQDTEGTTNVSITP